MVWRGREISQGRRLEDDDPHDEGANGGRHQRGADHDHHAQVIDDLDGRAGGSAGKVWGNDSTKVYHCTATSGMARPSTASTCPKGRQGKGFTPTMAKPAADS